MCVNVEKRIPLVALVSGDFAGYTVEDRRRVCQNGSQF